MDTEKAYLVFAGAVLVVFMISQTLTSIYGVHCP